MAEAIAACDWRTSPLGPPEFWPPSLKTIMRVILPSKAQIALFWGPEYVSLYNHACARAMGDKHPRAFGRPAAESCPELWDELEQLLRRVRDTGEAVYAKDRPFHLERHGHGEDIYVEISYSPVPEENGTVGGVLCIVTETTERVVAERRQDFLLKLSDALRPLGDPGMIKSVATRVLGESLGASRCFYAEVDGEYAVIEGCFHSGVPNVDGRYAMAEYGKALTDRLCAGHVILSHDTQQDPEMTRSERALNQANGIGARISVPLVKDGRLVSYLAVHQSIPRLWSAAEIELVRETAERTWDAVERARALAALRQNEKRRVGAYDALPVGIGFIDVRGRLIYANREMQRYVPTGIMPSLDPSRLWRWSAHHPDGRKVEPKDFPGARALRGERVVPGLEMLYTDDEGRTVWTRFAAVSIRDDEGRVSGCVVVFTDIDALKRAQETQQLLIGELQHRTRNLLAIVRSIARQTQRTTDNSQEFFARFHERLEALSRVQSHLSRGDGHGADLRQLVDSELIAHGASAEDRRVSLRGPNVDISSKALQVLALALHELCTNAVKHGALGQDQAKLAVSWDVSHDDGAGVLELDWVETGVRLSWPPSPRKGFGRELIERAIPYDLNGKASWLAEPDGVHCKLRVPLAVEQVS